MWMWFRLQYFLNRQTAKTFYASNYEKSYTNNNIPVKRVVELTVEYNGQFHIIEAFVIDTESPPILGKPGIEKFALCKEYE